MPLLHEIYMDAMNRKKEPNKNEEQEKKKNEKWK